MVCRNLHQGHLQEVGLMQVLADHDSETIGKDILIFFQQSFFTGQIS